MDEIEILTPEAIAEAEADLAEVLREAVLAGGAVEIRRAFPLEEARAFWRETVAPLIRSGARVAFGARVDGRIAATVQLHLETPPNQPHHCQVTKLLTHPSHRRRGLAKRLMLALEAEAWRRGKTLITLDTRTGEAAEALYRALGYETAGVIPHFARNPTDEGWHSTTYMYRLRSGV